MTTRMRLFGQRRRRGEDSREEESGYFREVWVLNFFHFFDKLAPELDFEFREVNNTAAHE